MANYNINQIKLEEYASGFAQKACDSFFSMFKTQIIGTEIMKITPLEQINYFILFNIFETWKQEINKLESPYFDYSKPEVKESLRNFMNTISMNIRINRVDFEPLLKKSVVYSFNLCVIPKMFYANFFNKLPEKITTEHLISLEKYFKLNKELYSEVLQKVKELNKEEITKTFLLNTFTEIAENHTLDERNKDAFIFNLNSIHPLNMDELYIPITASSETSINNSDENTINSSNTTESSLNNLSTEELPDKSQSIDNLKKENYRNNSQLNNKVIDTKAALTINQRFMFIEQLFKGEKWEFDNALSKLEAIDNYEEAINLLLSEYAIKYDWDTENEQVAELFDFVGKKYVS